MGKKSKFPIDMVAFAAEVAAETVARHGAAHPAFRGPLTSHVAIEAVARISGPKVAYQAAMRSYANAPAVRSEVDDAWVERQLARRAAWRMQVAKLLGISSATAAAWDPDAVIHVVDR